MALGLPISHAKEAVSIDEFATWAAYIERFGSINPARQITWYGALNAFTAMLAAGNKETKLSEFLPHNWDGSKDDAGDEIRPFSVEDMQMIAAALGASAKPSKKGERLYKIVKKTED